MKKFIQVTKWILFPFVLSIMSIGCTGSEIEPAPTAVTENTVTAPGEVILVRDAVLDFLRDGANECVPPAGITWQTSKGGKQTPAGYALYRFTTSDHCTIAISYLLSKASEPVYHVALGHGATGFCWQALVDGQGRILETGKTANTDPVMGNPAQIYCETQGYRFEVETKPSGLQCGSCVFTDGSRCNGWSYLLDECHPGEFPADKR